MEASSEVGSALSCSRRKGEALHYQVSQRRRRRGVVLGLCGSFVVVPMLSLVRPAQVRSATTRVAVIGVDPTALRRFAQRASRSETQPDLLEVSSTVAAAAARAPTTTTTARALAATSVSSRRTSTTARRAVPTAAPTSRPPAPPTTVRPQPPPPPPPPPNVQYGTASWLDSIPAGTCANNAAPLGAILTVTDTDTGGSIRCQVVSRGPFGPGRVVDLAEGTFAQLAPPSQGLVNVRVTW